MGKKMKNRIHSIYLIFLSMYSILSIPFLIDGLSHSSWPYLYDHACNKPTARIMYFFPTYQLGCWLGSVPGDNNENNR